MVSSPVTSPVTTCQSSNAVAPKLSLIMSCPAQKRAEPLRAWCILFSSPGRAPWSVKITSRRRFSGFNCHRFGHILLLLQRLWRCHQEHHRSFIFDRITGTTVAHRLWSSLFYGCFKYLHFATSTISRAFWRTRKRKQPQSTSQYLWCIRARDAASDQEI